MRSIRLSLMLYFLLLWAAALGGVAYFCYQSTQEALAAKESSTVKLWEKQFEENRQRILDDFDKTLGSQTRALAKKALLYHDRAELLSVALGGLAFVPHNGGGEFAVLPNLVASTFPPFAVKLHGGPQGQRPNILIESVHGEESVVQPGQYFQTYLAGKDQAIVLEQSRTLTGVLWRLDKSIRSKADNLEMPIDEIKMPAGNTVRRVTWKVNIGTSRRGVVVEPKLNGKGPNFPGPPLPQPNEDRPINPGRKPAIYLQYGVDTADRDEAIANLHTKLVSDLAELHADLDQTRLRLGARLLWIGLGTFAALFLGGFFLVRLGLSPLNRLSEAVSKVSEKDFHLPIDEDHLPVELKPIAGRLSETLDQLKRVFEREKEAAADMSHELRTPVAALLTTLDIALRKPRSADEYREVLEDCRSSGKQINQLVERLLTLARLNAGADMLRPREVDVVALADQCVALVRPLAEARGLRLRVHHNGPASMNADPDKLREVLTNLLHNAIEYNKPAGSIDVQVSRHNGTLEMEVRDTGIGISSDARHRIFERFYRADPSRHSDESPHAGLGLAIVKGYIDLMGGSIDVDSTVGTGSTFRVRLPVL
jgi:signal transduction histidine kinase